MSDAEREQHWRRMAEAGWSLDGRSVRELLARLDAERAATAALVKAMRRVRTDVHFEQCGHIVHVDACTWLGEALAASTMGAGGGGVGE